MDIFDQASFRRMLKDVLLEVARDVFALRPPALVRPDPNAPGGVDRILLRPSEAAKALAISERHLSKLCNAGKIPCVRITRLVRHDPAGGDLLDQLRRRLWRSSAIRRRLLAGRGSVPQQILQMALQLGKAGQVIGRDNSLVAASPVVGVDGDQLLQQVAPD